MGDEEGVRVSLTLSYDEMKTFPSFSYSSNI